MAFIIHLGPTCQSSMLDMKRFWEYLDGEVLATEMPKEYENFLVDILCKDCHKVNLKKMFNLFPFNVKSMDFLNRNQL